jgi:peptidoglycan/LPS O-acetylase OafA/YrhL
MSSTHPVIHSLTGLRWWAAFAVFFFHMTVFAPLPIHPVFEYGYYGVMFFFVLSGFVLSYSWKADIPLRTFYLRRIGRIWPSAFVALILAVPVFYSFNPDPSDWWVKPFDAGVLLLSLVLIQGWWLAPTILFSGNPAAWTLTCEFFFYSLHPFIQRMMVRIKISSIFLLLVTVFMAIVAIKTSCLLSSGEGCADLPLPIARLHEFILGMGVGVLARKGWLLKLPIWIPIALMFLFFSFLTLASRISEPDALVVVVLFFADEITLALIVLTIACVAEREFSGHKTGFEGKTQVKLGELSFNFYLVHATVMYVFVTIFGELDVTWNNLVWYPLVLAGGLLVALGLRVWVEKPFESRIRRFADRAQSKTL